MNGEVFFCLLLPRKRRTKQNSWTCVLLSALDVWQLRAIILLKNPVLTRIHTVQVLKGACGLQAIVQERNELLKAREWFLMQEITRASGVWELFSTSVREHCKRNCVAESSRRAHAHALILHTCTPPTPHRLINSNLIGRGLTSYTRAFGGLAVKRCLRRRERPAPTEAMWKWADAKR